MGLGEVLPARNSEIHLAVSMNLIHPLHFKQLLMIVCLPILNLTLTVLKKKKKA